MAEPEDVSFIDYYSIFGIKPTATPDQIKTAYKSLSLRYHPDKIHAKFPTATEAEIVVYQKRYLMVQQGWGVLSDSSAKQEFDKNLRTSNLLLLESHYTLNFSDLEVDFDDDGDFTIPCHRCSAPLVVFRGDNADGGPEDLDFFTSCLSCNMRYCIKYDPDNDDLDGDNWIGETWSGSLSD